MAQESYVELEVTKGCLKGMEDEYGKLIKVFDKQVKDCEAKILEGWKGTDANDFINKNLIPAVKDIINEINKVFQSVSDTVNQSAKNYAQRFLNGVYTAVTHHPIACALNPVGTFTGTVIGITSEQAISDAENALKLLESQAQDIMNRAVQLSRKSGFHGQGQEAKFSSSMNNIKKSIEGVTKEFGGATKKVTRATVDAARQIGKANAQVM